MSVCVVGELPLGEGAGGIRKGLYGGGENGVISFAVRTMLKGSAMKFN